MNSLFTNHDQRLVDGVEKRVCCHIVPCPDPILLQYSPESFGNVQMWGIRRQVEKEKASFLLDRPQLPYLYDCGGRLIVKYDKGVLPHTERECIEKAGYLIYGDTLRGETLIMVLAVNHSDRKRFTHAFRTLNSYPSALLFLRRKRKKRKREMGRTGELHRFAVNK